MHLNDYCYFRCLFIYSMLLNTKKLFKEIIFNDKSLTLKELSAIANFTIRRQIYDRYSIRGSLILL